MAEKKFSELSTASQVNDSDIFAISQSDGQGSFVSLKATILALSNKIVSGINFSSALQTTNKTITGAINEVAQGGGGGGASTEIIADDFDSTSTYAVGDYVVYDGKLYKCTTAVSTAGQWDANDWIETIVMDEVGQGGGGTTVVANPSGQATADLEKLQVGNDIYSIPSGGTGGGGDIRINDRNWTLITSSYGTTQLTNTYDYYLWVVSCNGVLEYYKVIDASLLDLETNDSSLIDYATWNDGAGAYSNSRFTLTSTSITLWDNAQSAVTQKVYGANAQGGGGYTDVTGTLTAGQTSITLSHGSITTNSTIDFYTSIFGVNPTAVSVSTGSVTLTFEAQSSNMDVKVRVS